MEDALSDLKRYDVVLPGRGGSRTTTLQLTDAEASARGVLGQHQKAKKSAANKAADANSSKDDAADKTADSADDKTGAPAGDKAAGAPATK